MKKLMLILAAAVMAVACGKTNTYIVEGQIDGYDGVVSVTNIDGNEEIVAATAENGKFTIEVESATPLFAALALDLGDGEGVRPIIPLFIDGTPIVVNGNIENVEAIEATGTESNQAYADYNKAQVELLLPIMNGTASEEEFMNAFATMQALVDESYEANKTNLWGAYLFISGKYRELSAEEILATVEAYPKELQKVEELVMVREYAEKMINTEIGKKYINITLPNAEGEKVSLKEVVEANKVVLLDFWASWCRPCMGEMPYLLEAYANYHDKGFEIYGVSLDDDGEAWKATIERQGMKWVNVSELKGWQTPAAQDYSVNAIPANFLIGEDGKIIAKDLRGEDLVALLAEIFE